MIKLGTTNGSILLSVSISEFKSLVGNTPSNIPDGAEISSAKAFAKIALVDAKMTELSSIKAQGQELINSLTAIGVA